MYKKILVPLDGSELAECALNHVKSLIQQGTVEEVVLFNSVVVDIPWRALNIGEEGHSTTFDMSNYIKTFTDKAKKYLAKAKYRLASELSSEEIKIKIETAESNRPAEAITEYARENGVDLIVIATHGYSGMKKMLLGSVALQVLNGANVPVLVIRPEACRL